MKNVLLVMKFSSPTRCQLPAKRAIVWLLRSECIYRNLSFEDWLFRNFDFTDVDGLLIWRNRPAVVVGRHQNCYLECDVEYAKDNDIDIVRRNSGGGTVFHDLNNVNFSFFTCKQRYDRLKNLNLTKTALKKYYNIDVEVTKRHDLVLNGDLKISGTAAKLAAKNAYHHFTLLVDLNKQHMKNVLRSSLNVFENSHSHIIESKATQSIRSKVGFLKHINPNINFDSVINAVIEEFSRSYQDKDIVDINNPSSDSFIGLDSTEKEFRSWNWNFGRNPPFSLSEMSANMEQLAKLDINKGNIVDYKCKSPERLLYWSQLMSIGDKFNVSLCKTLFTVDFHNAIGQSLPA